MAQPPPPPQVMVLEQHCVVTPHKEMICGGLSEAKPVDDHHKALFEEFRDIIETQLQSKFKIPKDFKIEPAKVRTQVVAGTNYYFHVRLPNGQFAHVKIFKPLPCYADQFTDRSKRITVEDETTKD